MTRRLEYLRYAADCREMARVSLPSYRKQLLDMAGTWERLAQTEAEPDDEPGKDAP